MELKPLLLYAGENLECFANNQHPPIAEGPYKFTGNLPVSAMPGDALVYSQSRNKRFVYVGVLKNTKVNRESRTLSFSRFEPFPVNVVAWDEDLSVISPGPNLQIGGFAPDFSYVSKELLDLVRNLGSRDFAKDFACRFVSFLDRVPDYRKEILRVAAQPDLDPQKELHWLVEKIFARVSKELGLRSDLFRTDFEGEKRTGKQMRSYPLLGTWSHPDAAVLAPFRCAIEYDRQPAERNTSHLKVSLGKTAAHVLSGAYDSAIQIYLLRNGTDHSADTYTSDDVGTTKRFLEGMNRLGVYIHIG